MILIIVCISLAMILIALYVSILHIHGSVSTNFKVVSVVTYIVVMSLLIKLHYNNAITDTGKVYTLTCNGVVVAESTRGWYMYKGVYKEYNGGMSYTPRQGDLCREYRRE